MATPGRARSGCCSPWTTRDRAQPGCPLPRPGLTDADIAQALQQAVTRLADQAAADLETFRAWLCAPAEDAGAHGQADPQQTASDEEGGPVHDIISDIIDWDQANKAYMAGEGQSGERYIQRLDAAGQMAEIEARWHHIPGGFLGARKLIKDHIQAVAESTQVKSKEELCWLAIAAATAWLPVPEPAEAAPP